MPYPTAEAALEAFYGGEPALSVCKLTAAAGLGRVWPHMLRHSCGYYPADQGTDLCTIQDYLGHRDPKHTAHYPGLPGIGSKGCGSSLRPTPAVTPPPEPDAQPTCARTAG